MAMVGAAEQQYVRVVLCRCLAEAEYSCAPGSKARFAMGTQHRCGFTFGRAGAAAADMAAACERAAIREVAAADVLSPGALSWP
ncbi:hypothetical protein ABH935_004352 [Catenulispora sp. GAS73]